jgi:geranylgeranyl diphosphate synthase type II
MIELKTAALLAGSALIGAILGGGSESDCRRLYDFALEVGLAFQLQDDLLDSFGDERLGKKIGGDILEGKKTYLMISALNAATPEEQASLRAIPRDESLNAEEKISRTLAIFDRYDVKNKTEQEINRRFAKALAALAEVDANAEALAELKAFVEGLMGRDK